MKKTRILIDTDFGDDVDDAAAFMLAFSSPELELAGVTTVFKDTEKRAQMVRDLLELWGQPSVPVAAGYGRALIERRFDETEEPIQYGILRHPWETGAAPGQRGETSPEGELRADDLILRSLKEDEDLVILAMGAMTNLAVACIRDPERMRRAKVIGMGGAFLNSQPEWNIICDPEAARIVMETVEDLVMMGLDVTKYLKIGEERLDAWRRRGDERMDYFLAGVEAFQKATGYPVTFHDVLLVAYLLDEQVVSLKKGEFTVELGGGLTRGTMVDRTGYYEIDPPVRGSFRFADRVDLERFFRILDERF